MAAEVHLNPVPGTTVVAHNPGAVPLHPGAGQPITQTKDASGKATQTHGQVSNTNVIFHSPA